MSKPGLVVSAACCLFVAMARAQGPAPQTRPQNAAGRDWPVYGGTAEGTRYSTLRQITRANVSRLTQAWQFDPHEGPVAGRFQANPVVVSGVLYTTTPGGSLIALDGATGALKWSWNSGTRGSGRGVTYWSAGRDRRILAGFGRYVYAVDAVKGVPIKTFGRDGRIDLHADLGRDPEAQAVTLSTPGVIYKDLYIIGGRTSESLPASPGDVRAYDVRSGALRWSFHTIPHPGETGYETWPAEAWTYSGSANNWAGMAVDVARGIVYVPTGSAASDFYGANRLGDNLFATTLLALDANTGRRIWHFQGVRHDIWDRDFPSPPTLVTVMRDGKAIDAVAQTTKQGVLFLFDRATGTPLFPIEYRNVPPSTTDGEVAADTQAFPLRPLPFARQQLTEDMLTTRTPEAHQWALDRLRTFRSEGQFVPLSEGKETVVFPGFDGGAEWGGSALDPTSGVIYVNANDVPWSGSLRLNTPATSIGRQTYLTQCAACHGENMQGNSGFPPLQDLRARRTPEQVTDLLRAGLGRMPSFASLPGSGRLSRRGAAVGHVERHQSEHRRVRLEGAARRVSGARGAWRHRHRLGELRRTDRDCRRAGVHRRHQLRPEVPCLRQGHGEAVVGDHAAQFRQRDPGDLRDQGEAVRGDPRLRRLPAAGGAAVGRPGRRSRAAGARGASRAGPDIGPQPERRHRRTVRWRVRRVRDQVKKRSRFRGSWGSWGSWVHGFIGS